MKWTLENAKEDYQNFLNARQICENCKFAQETASSLCKQTYLTCQVKEIATGGDLAVECKYFINKYN